MKTNKIQHHYTGKGNVYQLVLPMEIGELIPSDDSVRLLDEKMEEMDYSALYASYSRYGRIEASPKKLFKILVYGYMNGITSSRKLEQACRRDINFMYLLGREKAPDHNTIARFRSKRLVKSMDNLFSQFTTILEQMQEITGETLYVDGTKLTANANRYTFVWKKSVNKNDEKMRKKIDKEIPEIASSFGISLQPDKGITARTLKKLRNQLKRRQREQGVEFVYGTGKRKHPLQKAIEKVDDYLGRTKKYNHYRHILGERNSFSKTDHDATFMRMKDDHMRNGQLKPGYKALIGVDAKYITAAIISSERSDSKTLIPLLESIKHRKYNRIVADAGFESQENYTYLEKHHLEAFIKPSNYENTKTRKFKNDISRRENMPYDKESDAYTCHTGRKLKAVYERKTKSKAGYPS